jgi:hypothetical protein
MIVDSRFGIKCGNLRVRLAALLLISAFLLAPRPALGQELETDEAGTEQISPLQSVRGAWEDWPHSKNFKITLEYRNYSYIEGENLGDSRDSINQGRLRVEYDRDVGDNMRVYVDALLQADDDEFTHGFVDDFEDDDLRRNYFNFTEAFLDVYFSDFDLRLGKQIITWGKADVYNPTNNVNPTDYTDLLDDEYIGVVAANFNYYWNDWNLQLVGVPGFTPSRFPPVDTRFSLLPPGGVTFIEPFPAPVPIEDPVLPSNTINNMQFGARLQTTYSGWDFIFDGDTEDARFQYVIGVDYTKSDVIFDHDIFAIVEYVGEEVTKEGSGFDTGSAVDRVLVSAVAGNITYEFTDYTKLELRGAVDFHQGDDYFIQSQLVHDMTDDFEITVGLDILGGPSDTFFGRFRDNDRVFVKLKYTF